MKEKIVVKSNELIQKFRYSYSLREQKVIALICALAKEHEAEINELDDCGSFKFSIPARDFYEIFGVKKQYGTFYAEVKEIFEKLQRKSTWAYVNISGVEAETQVSWINEVYITNGEIWFYMNRCMYTYVCNLNSKFTSYGISNIFKMRKQYSIKLYELLKSYAGLNLISFDILEFEKLVASDHIREYLDHPSFFINRMIAPSIDEINSLTDINVEYQIIYSTTGRKAIEGITFKIKSSAAAENKIDNKQPVLIL